MRWLWPLLFVVGCDDLNKPMKTPKAPFSTSSSSSSSSGAAATDGGDGPDGGSPSTVPSVTPQPGDIQI